MDATNNLLRYSQSARKFGYETHQSYDKTSVARKAFSPPNNHSISSGPQSSSKRRPHSTVLPTPHKLSHKPFATKSQRQRDITFPVADPDSVKKGPRKVAVHANTTKRKVARKSIQQIVGHWTDKQGRLRNPESDSDSPMDHVSSSSESDREVSQPRKPSIRKTITRPNASKYRAMSISSEENEGEEEEIILDKGTQTSKAVLNNSSEDEQNENDEDADDDLPDTESEMSDSDSDVEYIGDNIDSMPVPLDDDALVQVVRPFLPRLQSQKLPFLKRNLRDAFKQSFPRVSSGLGTNEVVMQVMFRSGADQKRRTFTLHSWSCPLCQLLGKLDSRQMLDSHLHWHHSEVEIFWLREQENEWRLILTFPESSTLIADPSPAPHFPWASTREIASDEVPSEVNDSITSLTLDEEDAESQLRLSPFTPGPTHPARSPTPSPILPSLSEARLPQNRLSIGQPRRYLSQPPADHPPGPAARYRPSQGQSSSAHPRRYPSPPPADNPLGPAARYPYLPASSDDGSILIKYSCRPGGPYLYDLLDTLPLDEFGTLSWVVLDREAEIYESDDMCDEYKVMHALWGRWIMLNRTRFIQDYSVGVMDFVDQYWMMIHRAAGWQALRYWLLMLMVNKYLKPQGVANVLQHYEGKTGMKYWYANGANTD